MIGYKYLLIIGFFLVLLSPVQVDAKKRRSRKAKTKAKPAVIVQTDSTGQLLRKKRTPEELFDALNSVLEAMSQDMDEFNFDKIHPHLKIIYALYNELRILAMEDQDSLSDTTGSTTADSSTGKINPAMYIKKNESDSIGRNKTSSDSSLTIVIESPDPSLGTALKISKINPVMDQKKLDPTKAMTDQITGNRPSSFSLSWSDTSFQEYIIKFEIVEDTLGSFGWNIVFEKVDKLKNKTVKVHKYFDFGEFAISAQDLVWLTEEVKKAEREIEEAKDFLEDVIESCGDGIYITDNDGRVTRANAAFAAMLGRQKDEVEGAFIHEMMPELDTYPTTTGETVTIDESYFENKFNEFKSSDFQTKTGAQVEGIEYYFLHGKR